MTVQHSHQSPNPYTQGFNPLGPSIPSSQTEHWSIFRSKLKNAGIIDDNGKVTDDVIKNYPLPSLLHDEIQKVVDFLTMPIQANLNITFTLVEFFDYLLVNASLTSVNILGRDLLSLLVSYSIRVLNGLYDREEELICPEILAALTLTPPVYELVSTVKNGNLKQFHQLVVNFFALKLQDKNLDLDAKKQLIQERFFLDECNIGSFSLTSFGLKGKIVINHSFIDEANVNDTSFLSHSLQPILDIDRSFSDKMQLVDPQFLSHFLKLSIQEILASVLLYDRQMTVCKIDFPKLNQLNSTFDILPKAIESLKNLLKRDLNENEQLNISDVLGDASAELMSDELADLALDCLEHPHSQMQCLGYDLLLMYAASTQKRWVLINLLRYFPIILEAAKGDRYMRILQQLEKVLSGYYPLAPMIDFCRRQMVKPNNALFEWTLAMIALQDPELSPIAIRLHRSHSVSFILDERKRFIRALLPRLEIEAVKLLLRLQQQGILSGRDEVEIFTEVAEAIRKNGRSSSFPSQLITLTDCALELLGDGKTTKALQPAFNYMNWLIDTLNSYLHASTESDEIRRRIAKISFPGTNVTSIRLPSMEIPSLEAICGLREEELDNYLELSELFSYPLEKIDFSVHSKESVVEKGKEFLKKRHPLFKKLGFELIMMCAFSEMDLSLLSALIAYLPVILSTSTVASGKRTLERMVLVLQNSSFAEYTQQLTDNLRPLLREPLPSPKQWYEVHCKALAAIDRTWNIGKTILSKSWMKKLDLSFDEQAEIELIVSFIVTLLSKPTKMKVEAAHELLNSLVKGNALFNSLEEKALNGHAKLAVAKNAVFSLIFQSMIAQNLVPEAFELLNNVADPLAKIVTSELSSEQLSELVEFIENRIKASNNPFWRLQELNSVPGMMLAGKSKQSLREQLLKEFIVLKQLDSATEIFNLLLGKETVPSIELLKLTFLSLSEMFKDGFFIVKELKGVHQFLKTILKDVKHDSLKILGKEVMVLEELSSRLLGVKLPHEAKEWIDLIIEISNLKKHNCMLTSSIGPLLLSWHNSFQELKMEEYLYLSKTVAQLPDSTEQKILANLWLNISQGLQKSEPILSAQVLIDKWPLLSSYLPEKTLQIFLNELVRFFIVDVEEFHFPEQSLSLIQVMDNPEKDLWEWIFKLCCYSIENQPQGSLVAKNAMEILNSYLKIVFQPVHELQMDEESDYEQELQMRFELIQILLYSRNQIVHEIGCIQLEALFNQNAYTDWPRILKNILESNIEHWSSIFLDGRIETSPNAKELINQIEKYFSVMYMKVLCPLEKSFIILRLKYAVEQSDLDVMNEVIKDFEIWLSLYGKDAEWHLFFLELVLDCIIHCAVTFGEKEQISSGLELFKSVINKMKIYQENHPLLLRVTELCIKKLLTHAVDKESIRCRMLFEAETFFNTLTDYYTIDSKLLIEHPYAINQYIQLTELFILSPPIKMHQLGEKITQAYFDRLYKVLIKNLKEWGYELTHPTDALKFHLLTELEWKEIPGIEAQQERQAVSFAVRRLLKHGNAHSFDRAFTIFRSASIAFWENNPEVFKYLFKKIIDESKFYPDQFKLVIITIQGTSLLTFLNQTKLSTEIASHFFDLLIDQDVFTREYKKTHKISKQDFYQLLFFVANCLVPEFDANGNQKNQEKIDRIDINRDEFVDLFSKQLEAMLSAYKVFPEMSLLISQFILHFIQESCRSKHKKLLFEKITPQLDDILNAGTDMRILQNQFHAFLFLYSENFFNSFQVVYKFVQMFIDQAKKMSLDDSSGVIFALKTFIENMLCTSKAEMRKQTSLLAEWKKKFQK